MRTKKPKEKHRYVFPNFLAKAMSKVDMRTQMESSMLSQFLLILGLSIMVIYMIISKQTTGFYKFIVIFNLLCGWLLISSYLVTTYQQYTNFSEAMGFDPAAEKAAVKKKGNIFKRIIIAIRNKHSRKRNNINQKGGQKMDEEYNDVEEEMDELEEEIEEEEEEEVKPKKSPLKKKKVKAVAETKPTERYLAFYQEARIGVMDTLTKEVIVEGLQDVPTATMEAIKLNKLDRIEIASGA